MGNSAKSRLTVDALFLDFSDVIVNNNSATYQKYHYVFVVVKPTKNKSVFVSSFQILIFLSKSCCLTINVCNKLPIFRTRQLDLGW